MSYVAKSCKELDAQAITYVVNLKKRADYLEKQSTKWVFGKRFYLPGSCKRANKLRKRANNLRHYAALLEDYSRYAKKLEDNGGRDTSVWVKTYIGSKGGTLKRPNYYCRDCNFISRVRHDFCPSCGKEMYGGD